MTSPPIPVQEPFPIYLVSSRYFLYDANVVSHARQAHRMCGCLTGTLPQIPQQNIFLGLPLELMTEEAALLVEKGAGYIVDDVQAHEAGLGGLVEADKAAYLAARDAESNREALAHQKAAEERKLAYTKPSPSPSPKADGDEDVERVEDPRGEEEEGEEGEGGLSETAPPRVKSPQPTGGSLTYYPTPSVSDAIYHSLPLPDSKGAGKRPEKTSGYPLYKHLHENGYYLSPGLRFGCQYMAYPGDPLRFHSHFVVTGMGWDEEIEMRDVVGGGRLGTGVKKAWMVGGEDGAGKVRTFCVEWGGFLEERLRTRDNGL